ncbi:MAG: dTDP-4-dehydrorhamnose 3,5-epimerase family protein [Oligoflexales bacterium]|nr:dTDP-4-dehydrorhamnose 3,5-epimerase family protein [Oligoflexales bacterium]
MEDKTPCNEDFVKTGIEGLIFIPRKIIRDNRGAVFHMLRSDSSFFNKEFGEVYFSTVKPGVSKGWKRHLKMIQRYVVPIGSVKFVFFDSRQDSSSRGRIEEIELGEENYGLLIVPNLITYSFKCESIKESLIVNCASIPHTPGEGLTIDPSEVPYEWSDELQH